MINKEAWHVEKTERRVTMISQALLWLLIGLGASVWLYIAARLVSRAIVRTLEEKKERKQL